MSALIFQKNDDTTRVAQRVKVNLGLRHESVPLIKQY